MVREGEFRARDGRRVTYGVFGADDGSTVVHCHGGAESHVFEVDPEWTISMGVRVVTPNRPGFATSDPSGDRDVASWTDDLVDLAEHLGIDELSVLGWSAGGPHALAAGARCPDLVSAVTVVASPAPLQQAPELEGLLSPTMRLLVDYIPVDREASAAIVSQVAEAWVGDPDEFIHTGTLPPSDHAVLDDPELGTNLRAQILEGLRTTAGIARDSIAVYGPWGFDPGNVTVPTSIWQGGADGVVHRDNAAWLAKAVPGATLHELPDGGHFILLSHWGEILADHLQLRTHPSSAAGSPTA